MKARCSNMLLHKLDLFQIFSEIVLTLSLEAWSMC